MCIRTGLVHISQITNRYINIRWSSERGDVVDVQVLTVDVAKADRLTMKIKQEQTCNCPEQTGKPPGKNGQ